MKVCILVYSGENGHNVLVCGRKHLNLWYIFIRICLKLYDFIIIGWNYFLCWEFFTCVRFQMSSSSSSSGISPPSVRHEVLFGTLGAHASPPSALSSPPPPPSALSYPPGIRPPPFQRTSGPSRGGPPLLYRYPNGPDWQTTKCKVGKRLSHVGFGCSQKSQLFDVSW